MKERNLSKDTIANRHKHVNFTLALVKDCCVTYDIMDGSTQN